ncbi:nuclear transport factor 2 family protein [Olivibacter sp. SDN3]|uniref:nuclear transport factor 2 family protein n=1 Tax=Olivibacter sp. SDN3 TaxID=2764720 RepID=UPI0016518BAA|nr:nuclear transport factor 2 family protein [Olivibacter sp. SDN3]QNL51787.1 nuclear transport factor 2 family protein [Olivibacter sp. SDN3]
MEKIHVINSLLILLISVGHTSSYAQSSSMDASKKALIAHQFEQWQQGSANFFDILAEDVVWIVAGHSPVSGVYHGKKAFMEQSVLPITSQLKTRIEPTLVSLTADESYVWLHWKGTATAVDGRDYRNNYCWKLEVKDGLITSAIAFLDTYELTLLMNKKQNAMNSAIEETKEYMGNRKRVYRPRATVK